MIELRAGEEIAGYRVIEPLGAGGMGRVYRAVQPRLERMVALKVIRPELAADASFQAQFRREARLAASIDHPGVVPVYEAGEVDDVLFVAMRWVNGSDLRNVLAAEAPLKPARAVAMIGAVAEALAATHNAGLVHRDIKPSNILVEGERVYLTDFGLARPTAGPDVTVQTAGFMGTVDYAAPEVLDGRPPDGRADIYGLGCVLYEMLTGSVPFPMNNLLATLHAHATAERPRPSALRPDLPRGLDRVVQRAMARDPEARYLTALEFATAAREALGEPAAGAASAPPERPSRRRRAVAAAALSALVLAGVVVAVVLATSGGSHAARRTFAAPARVATTARAAATAPPTTDGARKLPAASSLPSCSVGPSGPLRGVVCHDSSGGVGEYGAQGDVVRMSTMDVQVTRVRVTPTIRSPAKTVRAPAGGRFIVINATVTNRTNRTQVFEPDAGTAPGRQTSLFLFTAAGGSMVPVQPGVADYSTQSTVGVAAVPNPLSQTTLPPRVPYHGELVYAYPAKYLRTESVGFLQVLEFGEPFGKSWSVGTVRLHI